MTGETNLYLNLDPHKNNYVCHVGNRSSTATSIEGYSIELSNYQGKPLIYTERRMTEESLLSSKDVNPISLMEILGTLEGSSSIGASSSQEFWLFVGIHEYMKGDNGSSDSIEESPAYLKESTNSLHEAISEPIKVLLKKDGAIVDSVEIPLNSSP